MTKRILTEEDIAAHNAGKMRLLNASKTDISDKSMRNVQLVDSSGQPFTYTADVACTGEDNVWHVDMRTVHPNNFHNIIQGVLANWLHEQKIVDKETSELFVTPEELATRGYWCYPDNNERLPPHIFVWDKKPVIFYVY